MYLNDHRSPDGLAFLSLIWKCWSLKILGSSLFWEKILLAGLAASVIQMIFGELAQWEKLTLTQEVLPILLKILPKLCLSLVPKINIGFTKKDHSKLFQWRTLANKRNFSTRVDYQRPQEDTEEIKFLRTPRNIWLFMDFQYDWDPEVNFAVFILSTKIPSSFSSCTSISCLCPSTHLSMWKKASSIFSEKLFCTDCTWELVILKPIYLSCFTCWREPHFPNMQPQAKFCSELKQMLISPWQEDLMRGPHLYV